MISSLRLRQSIIPIFQEILWKTLRPAETTEEEVIDFVTAGIKANPELPFFIFCSNGGKEDVAPMTEQMKYITRQDCFSYGNDPKKNNIYFAVSDFYHTDYLVPYYLWNSLKVLFK